MHLFNLNINGQSSIQDLNSTNLSVDVDVETDQKNEGDDSVNHQIEINEVYLDVERVCPQMCGMKQCVAGVAGVGCSRVTNYNNGLQLKELRGVVQDRENYNWQNVE